VRARDAFKKILENSIPEIEVKEVIISDGGDKRGSLKISYDMGRGLKNYRLLISPKTYDDLNIRVDMMVIASLCVKFTRNLCM